MLTKMTSILLPLSTFIFNMPAVSSLEAILSLNGRSGDVQFGDWASRNRALQHPAKCCSLMEEQKPLGDGLSLPWWLSSSLRFSSQCKYSSLPNFCWLLKRCQWPQVTTIVPGNSWTWSVSPGETSCCSRWLMDLYATIVPLTSNCLGIRDYL